MDTLRDATVNEIHELAEVESKRNIGPLFENDADLQATCEMLTIEFGDLAHRFIDLHSVWEGKRSVITEQFDKELRDLMTEVENNSRDKLKEQLNASR